RSRSSSKSRSSASRRRPYNPRKQAPRLRPRRLVSLISHDLADHSFERRDAIVVELGELGSLALAQRAAVGPAQVDEQLLFPVGHLDDLAHAWEQLIELAEKIELADEVLFDRAFEPGEGRLGLDREIGEAVEIDVRFDDRQFAVGIEAIASMLHHLGRE